jgi:hypothetical protein
MNLKPILCACVTTALALAAPAQAAASGAPSAAATAEFFGYGTSFRLHGTNGYDLEFTAFTERRDGRGEIAVFVSHRSHRSRGPRRLRQPHPRLLQLQR